MEHNLTTDKFQYLQKIRQERLSEPFLEKIRPQTIDDIIGQEEACISIENALSSDRPKNIILLGPDGVGKKDAAMVIFKKIISKDSSIFFNSKSKFIEYVPGVKYEEDYIGDPLFGAVYIPKKDGAFKIPRLKIGAVSHANKGILFINKLCKLDINLLNKLADVMEQKKVYIDIKYKDKKIPWHIYNIFKNGFPADFCLVAAINDENKIPVKLRRMCDFINFRELTIEEIMKISQNAAKKALFNLDFDAGLTIAKNAKSGSDAVKLIQRGAIMALKAGRINITIEDIEIIKNKL
ncbi:sigma 54-interacting transcriptional regulator [Aceticella autotrophica]|uniref:Sigma 54-interacting transcriptional regulator n=1 Tax=Aceticella autotrophica TaxID=2755338 RepID=A0A975GB34_9THEO|nr:ATP-binding protein [Aceticella autotrophica]QSZ27747.1 sigma 54-interacting transcriptional regulator [Aceticella autotrophica]